MSDQNDAGEGSRPIYKRHLSIHLSEDKETGDRVIEVEGHFYDSQYCSVYAEQGDGEIFKLLITMLQGHKPLYGGFANVPSSINSNTKGKVEYL